MTTIQRGPATTIRCGLTGAILLATAMPLLAADPPARLRLRVNPPSIAVGARAGVTIEFLNRDFRPVRNDRDRGVRVQLRPTGGRVEAKGQITPLLIRVPAGAFSFSGATLTAVSAGVLRVWAESDGLAPADALVRVGSKSTLRRPLFESVVHAQSDDSVFELLPRELKIPFSALPSGQLYIVLNESVDHRVSWQVTTDPATRIRYNDRVSNGVALVAITEGAQSDPIIIEPSAVGRIAVVARRLPKGPEVRTDLQVIPQVPRRVSLTPAHARLAANIALVPLAITLVGEDGAPLRALGESHEIELRSSTTSWILAPERIRLSPEKPVENHILSLPHFRLGANLNLLARDTAGLLTSDTMDLQVVAARPAVLVLAIVAGILGSVARLLYRDRKVDLYPRVVNGRLAPGLLVNGAFGALFGVVLFQLVDLGLLHTLAHDMDHDEPGLAFLLGLGGGFAGIRVLDILTKLVFQGMGRWLPSSSGTPGDH